METAEKKRIALIGAGIAGLVCAYELKKRGHDVIIYENSDRVGGRMATRVKDGLEFNPGATFLSHHYHTLRAYAEEFRIPWHPMQKGSSHRVRRGGKSYYYNVAGPIDVLKLRVLSLPSRLRFLWFLMRLALRKIPGSFFDLSLVPESFDFDNASHYLRKAVGDEVVDYVADPFTTTLHFYLSDQVSTAMMFTLLKSLIGNPEFSAEYPVGGIQAIPNELARRLNVVTEARVESVIRGKDGNTVRVNDRDEMFDAVVFACPAPAVLGILRNPTESELELLQSVTYGSTITFAFKVPSTMFTDNTHCIYVPYVENKIIGSCIFEMRKQTGLLAEGKTLFNVYLHDQAAKELMNKSEEELLSIIIPELRAICPEFTVHEKDIVFHDIERWPRAMPAFPPGYVSKTRKFLENNQGVDNIYLIGDYMNSTWTEGAARCGRRTAEVIDNVG
ncbi:MAG: FAD-dependent oxidoreductase [Candidatus Vogelbacteria bacterium]|nr:FAD-dependent oxidoreductase [Candidatus Vogelbacteria bacterium]